MEDLETQKKFIKLRAKGMSYQKISAEIGVHEGTLINWAEELRMEIKNARALELEALQDKYYLLKERRIKLFGEKLKALSEELDNRDYSDVKTEKLFDLFFKIYKLLEKEAEEVEYTSDKKIEENKAWSKAMNFSPPQ